MTKLLRAMFGKDAKSQAFAFGLLDGMASSRYVVTPGVAELRASRRSRLPSDVRAQRRVAHHLSSAFASIVDHD